MSLRFFQKFDNYISFTFIGIPEARCLIFQRLNFGREINNCDGNISSFSAIVASAKPLINNFNKLIHQNLVKITLGDGLY